MLNRSKAVKVSLNAKEDFNYPVLNDWSPHDLHPPLFFHTPFTEGVIERVGIEEVTSPGMCRSLMKNLVE